jgi:hypothetical protein
MMKYLRVRNHQQQLVDILDEHGTVLYAGPAEIGSHHILSAGPNEWVTSTVVPGDDHFDIWYTESASIIVEPQAHVAALPFGTDIYATLDARHLI